MPSTLNYALHRGRLESSLLSRSSLSALPENTSLISLELQLKSRRRRQIFRHGLNDRRTSVNDQQELPQKEMVPKIEKEIKVWDLDSYAKDLEQWVKKMKCVTGMRIEQFCDIKVGAFDTPISHDAVSIEPHPSLVDNGDFKYKGVRDEHGLFKGKAVIEFANGDTLHGFFVKGKRQGECRTEISSSENTAIIGNYQNDKLTGKAKILHLNGNWTEAFFKEGVMHGFSRTFDTKGRLLLVGNYKNGRKSGVWWKMIRGGGCVVGRVNREEELTGYRFAYLYPDFKTALVGSFVNGVLDQGQEATLKSVIDDCGIKVPMFTECSGEIYKREVSTHDFMTNYPLLEDPYERKTTEVRKSNVGGAGDGLFARIDIETNTVIAFYNGKRFMKRVSWSNCQRYRTDSVNPNNLDWNVREHETWEDNAYKIFDPNDKKFTIDIPREFRNFDNYRASLAHKTNHSFMPNAEFVSYDHPRFGLVPCILTTHDIKAGEEIFVHYGYDLQECPYWYEEAWQTGKYPVPDALKRAGYEDEVDCQQVLENGHDVVDNQVEDKITNGTNSSVESTNSENN